MSEIEENKEIILINEVVIDEEKQSNVSIVKENIIVDAKNVQTNATTLTTSTNPVTNSNSHDPRGPYAGDAKLFVANLPFKITAQQLEELFSRYGSVSNVSINIDKLTGKSKGFAFITMDDARDAADAMKGLHHYSLDGRNISIDVAHGGGSNTGVIVRPKVHSHSKKSKGRNSDEQDRSNRNSDPSARRSRSRSRER